MFEVTVIREFSAAHRVEDYPGNCERLHGHNWKVEITASSRQLDSLGMVVDFRKLKDATDHALEGLDHAFLNDLPAFKGVNPTAENIAHYLCEAVGAEIPVSKVRVFETDTSVATYIREPGG
jgi:6-pyruvoyltetrahydropterin/6-carboxytetrahydropterin synthase